MIIDLVLAAAGLGLLIVGGDLLVRGAVAASLRLGIPALVVSLTVVAFGTSAPELLVAVQAAIRGAPDIGVGNVVGSNIANILLVLGLPALIHPILLRDGETRRIYLLMGLTSVAFVGLCFLAPLGIWHGVVLLALMALVLHDNMLSARAGAVTVDPGLLEGCASPLRTVLYLAGGIAVLPFGADFLIDGARGVARAAGVSEAAIGLTLVAVGTSLPELATSVMAALRRHADVAMGNVIGSNIFNLALIMGVTSFFGPVAIAPHFLQLDLWIMLAATALLGPFVWFDGRIGRRAGGAFVAAYAAYAWLALS
ncbi:MAG: sodium:calcium antiporter [Alphaproteobacteria bacterium]|nr:MAG: sodium:calcium antiporter [Alphaproteobacteria bacterium]